MDMDRLCQLATRAENTPGTLRFAVKDTAREEAACGLYWVKRYQMCWLPHKHIQQREDLGNSISSLTMHLQITWGKFSFSSTTPWGKCLNFPPCFLLPASATEDFPSVTQRRLGRFPAGCFSGSWLREICWLPMLRGPSGYSQPCAGAAFLSAYSLC